VLPKLYEYCNNCGLPDDLSSEIVSVAQLSLKPIPRYPVKSKLSAGSGFSKIAPNCDLACELARAEQQFSALDARPDSEITTQEGRADEERAC
jgi:hypothetical protein